MNDDLKNKLDLLDIPAPSSNFESRILSEGLSASKKRLNNTQSVFMLIRSNITSMLTSSYKPMALAACLATFALLLFSKEGFHPVHNTVIVKTTLSEVASDEGLDEFTLFDEDEFLFEADWII